MNKPVGYWLKRLDGALEAHLDPTGMLDGNIILSEDGHRKRLEALRLMDEARADLTAGIGHDEYAIALGVLERRCANAERL